MPQKKYPRLKTFIYSKTNTLVMFPIFNIEMSSIELKHSLEDPAFIQKIHCNFILILSIICLI